MKIHPNGGADQTSSETLGPKSQMQYFRFLPDPAKLRKEARCSGVSSVPDIGERAQPSADVGAGTVTVYSADNGRLGVLVRLELYPNMDGPESTLESASFVSDTSLTPTWKR
jgi:hypothetical protein